MPPAEDCAVPVQEGQLRVLLALWGASMPWNNHRSVVAFYSYLRLENVMLGTREIFGVCRHEYDPINKIERDKIQSSASMSDPCMERHLRIYLEITIPIKSEGLY